VVVACARTSVGDPGRLAAVGRSSGAAGVEVGGHLAGLVGQDAGARFGAGGGFLLGAGAGLGLPVDGGGLGLGVEPERVAAGELEPPSPELLGVLVGAAGGAEPGEVGGGLEEQGDGDLVGAASREGEADGSDPVQRGLVAGEGVVGVGGVGAAGEDVGGPVAPVEVPAGLLHPGYGFVERGAEVGEDAVGVGVDGLLYAGGEERGELPYQRLGPLLGVEGEGGGGEPVGEVVDGDGAVGDLGPEGVRGVSAARSVAAVQRSRRRAASSGRSTPAVSSGLRRPMCREVKSATVVLLGVGDVGEQPVGGVVG
jgi:hypothetical protein